MALEAHRRLLHYFVQETIAFSVLYDRMLIFHLSDLLLEPVQYILLKVLGHRLAKMLFDHH